MTDFTFNLLMVYLGHQCDNLSKKERERNIRSLKRIRVEEALTDKQAETVDNLIKELEHDPLDDADPYYDILKDINILKGINITSK